MHESCKTVTVFSCMRILTWCKEITDDLNVLPLLSRLPASETRVIDSRGTRCGSWPGQAESARAISDSAEAYESTGYRNAGNRLETNALNNHDLPVSIRARVAEVAAKADNAKSCPLGLDDAKTNPSLRTTQSQSQPSEDATRWARKIS